ncbi:MAG TPA: MBL fold metallo-hydrolase [Deltaproteobacteria bacterium]|nr:MAG: MBL fold metallo-hydrolase [Deltaproteobacteria bacterium GWC2_65_14]HBO70393.1 MBL fold metallo-hydrolase [Deltaproteobacteria bacterium]
MTNVSEIAPDVYRISTYNANYQLQFNQFLVKDDEPLLFHTGMKGDFETIREAVARIVDPSTIRWLSFSHFESDECGSLNEWLREAPQAQPLCTVVAALVNVTDFASRAPRWIPKEDVLTTGKYRFRLFPTHHLPHSWDAGMLFEETNRTLFCSDLFLHGGDVDPLTDSDVIGKARKAMVDFQSTQLLNSYPYTGNTERRMAELADLQPRTLAIMHGSSFRGDGGNALRGLASVMREVLGNEE